MLRTKHLIIAFQLAVVLWCEAGEKCVYTCTCIAILYVFSICMDSQGMLFVRSIQDVWCKISVPIVTITAALCMYLNIALPPGIL